jgi:hypothetical protein
MKSLAFPICLAAWVGLAATTAYGSGQKMIEIDKAGNVRTSTGRDIGRAKDAPRKGEAAETKSAPSSPVDICAPGYTWSPEGVSPQSADRAQAFYRDVTQPYEREAMKAREAGAALSRAREAEYWNALGEFMKAVPEGERKAVQLGVSPRLSWYCNAPPVVPNAPQAPPAPQPPPPPRRY